MAIPIIIAFDDRFSPGAGVVMRSVFDHTDCPIRFVLLHGEVSPENRRRIEQVAAGRSSATIEWFDIAHAVAELPLPSNSCYNQMAYARLLSADLIPDSRAVYLDADTLVQRDVRELYEWDLGGAALAAAPDLSAQQRALVDERFSRYLQELMPGRPATDYLSSGVLVLNLDECRRRDLLHAVLGVVQSQTRLMYADQCALSRVLLGGFARLPPRWNALVIYQGMLDNPAASRTMRRAAREALADPALVHYVGYKPWTPFPTPFKRRYLEVLRRTPWGHEGFDYGSLTWRQSAKLANAWRSHALSLRLSRRQIRVMVLGKRVFDWSPSQRAA